MVLFALLTIFSHVRMFPRLNLYYAAKGLRVQASPAPLRCVLEQDTLILAQYWFHRGKIHPFITEILLMGRKESNKQGTTQ